MELCLVPTVHKISIHFKDINTGPDNSALSIALGWSCLPKSQSDFAAPDECYTGIFARWEQIGPLISEIWPRLVCGYAQSLEGRCRRVLAS